MLSGASTSLMIAGYKHPAAFAARQRRLPSGRQWQHALIDLLGHGAALFGFADQIIGRYENEKRRLGRYDYDDLIIRTLSMFRELEHVAWVLYKLDGGLDHILIDEAQDTSPEQWQIVQFLAEDFFSGEGQRPGVTRTIFAVGDRKQSIFSFQGADPDGFDAMRRHFQTRVQAARLGAVTVPDERGRPLAVIFSSTRPLWPR